MSNYSAAVAAIVKAHKTQLLLINEAHSRFLLQPHRSAKVCLFFHGFTATLQQFLPIAQAFAQLGYNVVIPLLPGHGIAGDWDSDNPPPLPEEPQVYQEFGLYWLQQVQPLGKKVVIR